VRERHNDGEDHCGGAYDGRANEHGLAVALNVLPVPSLASSISLARSKFTSMA